MADWYWCRSQFDKRVMYAQLYQEFWRVESGKHEVVMTLTSEEEIRNREGTQLQEMTEAQQYGSAIVRAVEKTLQRRKEVDKEQPNTYTIPKKDVTIKPPNISFYVSEYNVLYVLDQVQRLCRVEVYRRTWRSTYYLTPARKGVSVDKLRRLTAFEVRQRPVAKFLKQHAWQLIDPIYASKHGQADGRLTFYNRH